MFLIDRYVYNNRWRDLSVHVKASLYLILLVMSFSGVIYLQLGLMVGIFLLTSYLVKLSPLRYLTWYLPISVFVLISCLTLVVSYGQQESQFFWYFSCLGGYIGLTKAGLSLLLPLILRIYSSLIATYFFVLTVPFNQLVDLFKSLRLPLFLLELIILMYRFVFLVMREFLVMRHTLDLKFSFYERKKSYRGWGILLQSLFLRLLEDNQRLNEVLALKFDSAYRD